MAYVPAANGTYAIVHPQFPGKGLWLTVIAFRIDDTTGEIEPVLYPSGESLYKDSALLFPDGRVFWRGEYHLTFAEWREAVADSTSSP